MLGFSQLINKPTNFEPNKTPSCIDLIFSRQPNLVFESEIHPSLYNMCHHQIMYANFSLKIHFPPSYKRDIWHYNRAPVDLIKKSVKIFYWVRAFRNLSVNDQVELLEITLLNIFRNFIPHESIKCSHKDPPWTNKEIKSALRYQNRLHKKYISGGRTEYDKIDLQNNTNLVSNLITTTKDSYFINLGKKLNDPQTSPKTYWSILKRFLNKTKIPTIPPLLVNGTFKTDFRKKAGIFNTFFADQCSIINNESVLPVINYKTHKRLTNITISPEDLSSMIKDLTLFIPGVC